jgi:hypothetical protein
VYIRAHEPDSSVKPFHEAEPFFVLTAAGETSDLLFEAADVRAKEAELLRRLEELPPGGLLAIDFSGVRIASEAARQLLRRAVRRVTGGELPDRFLVLTGLSTGRYNIEVVLEGENLTMIERLTDGTRARLIGHVDPAVRDTYHFLLTQPTVRAKDVCEHFSLANTSTATNRLAALARVALAYRLDQEPVPGGGRQYVYAAVQ